MVIFKKLLEKKRKHFHKRILLFFGQILVLIGFLNSPLWAYDFRGLKVVPSDESRSIILDSKGQYKMGRHDSVEKARDVALNNAREDALKRAESMIKNKANLSKLEYTLLENKSGKYVTVLEKKDHGVKLPGPNYHVSVKAKVIYLMKPALISSRPKTASSNNNSFKTLKSEVIPANKPIKLSKLLEQREAPLTVRVWTNKKQFREGEHVTLYLQGNQDFYARIISNDTDNNVVQLLPNKYRQSSFFKRGEIYEIPDEFQGDKFLIESVPPFGTNTIVVYASKVPLGKADLTPLGKGLSKFRGDKEKYSIVVSRGLKIEKKGSSSPVEFHESTWKFDTTQN